MRAAKKKAKKTKLEKSFLFPEINLFFLTIFLTTEIDFFFENRQQFNARAGQKKHGFFGNARPKSNALAHLKQRKKT